MRMRKRYLGEAWVAHYHVTTTHLCTAGSTTQEATQVSSRVSVKCMDLLATDNEDFSGHTCIDLQN